MGPRCLAAFLIAATLVAPIAHAQRADTRKCADAEFDARSVALDDLGPFAGASYKSDVARSNSPACRVVTFYRLTPKLPEGATGAERRRILAEHSDKTAPPVFAARYIDDSRNASYQERWTDQRRCPALVSRIANLEPILAPKLTGDGPYRDVTTTSTHQPTIRFWMAGPVWPQRDEGYTLDIGMEGGGTAEFGKWLDETFKALDSCWSADPPVLP